MATLRIRAQVCDTRFLVSDNSPRHRRTARLASGTRRLPSGVPRMDFHGGVARLVVAPPISNGSQACAFHLRWTWTIGPAWRDKTGEADRSTLLLARGFRILRSAITQGR